MVAVTGVVAAAVVVVVEVVVVVVVVVSTPYGHSPMGRLQLLLHTVAASAAWLLQVMCVANASPAQRCLPHTPLALGLHLLRAHGARVFYRGCFVVAVVGSW